MRIRRAALAVAAVLLVCAASTPARPQGSAADDAISRALRDLIPGSPPGDERQPFAVEGAGLTPSGRRLWALEPIPADDRRPKVVLVAGLDGSAAGTDAVIGFVRWWLTDPAAAPLRAAWQIAALPCARPDLCDEPPGRTMVSPLSFPPAGGYFDGKSDPTAQYVWRWIVMQAPTLVIELADARATRWQANRLAAALVNDASRATEGSLLAALDTAATGPAWSRPVPALGLAVEPGGAVSAVGDILARAGAVDSPLRRTLLARQSRTPLDIARLLAPRYPAQPGMSYIPALAWSGALRLARLTGESTFRDKPQADMRPFLSGEKPTIAEPYLLTSLAGHLALSDLGALANNRAAADLARKGADFILPQTPDEVVRFARAWTDDMFMATSVLARVGARTGDPRYGAAAGRLLTRYAADLQRPDGLFIHAKEGPHAWGRGNGFAAFGLMEALTWLPRSWPDRGRVLEAYRAHMKALLSHQAGDGMWRQVVDEPGSYRELTVTAMVLTAMARGVRLGWLDASYRPVVDRAWRGLRARIAEDGTLMDVCTGTGAGPAKEYYLTRAGITGADDRGGAMALTAALEMEDLFRAAGVR